LSVLLCHRAAAEPGCSSSNNNSSIRR
jgi:hypothetical protein